MARRFSFSGQVVLGMWCAQLLLWQLSVAHAETVLYAFKGNRDGLGPLAAPIRDGAGNIYGTTSGGGAHTSGTVFRLAPGGVEAVLYSFCSLRICRDGQLPSSGLVRDKAGNLYGTTYAGGASGYGVVYEVTPTGVETVLHSFHGGIDGANPEGTLVADGAGNLYGTTSTGGGSANCEVGCGTIFRIAPSHAETVLYAFAGAPDGSAPMAGVTRDSDGSLYGTTLQGGAQGLGTVFKLSPKHVESVLYAFRNGNDGENPNAGLIEYNGDFYGTTWLGGTQGNGTVFRLTQGGLEKVLHSFAGADGSSPFTAGVVTDGAGNLYGTTSDGGAHGYGAVFKLTQTGTETVLYSFKGGRDGAGPSAGLLRSGGNLYGTTEQGGAKDNGIVFEVKQ